MTLSPETAPPPADCVPFDVEPDLQRIGLCWYARDAFAFLKAASDMPTDILADIRTWVRANDENVRRRRPFAVEIDARGRSAYSFDWFYRRDIAPRWWVEASREWCCTYGFDNRGQRLHSR